ncbi:MULTISPECIES: flagellar hook-basal body complex protein [Methylobacterium]|uniref:Flagellar hook protein FlgE n=2 Tax=Methylobacterium TaxID=407 RepID=A0AAE8HSB8_9HYPH|nr:MULTISPECIES: flagellar hook-basal body complex protein [Methylobacterium]KOX58866.1 flagellar hook protein FlgE [Streptomyces purpurogeneiscleroticus]AIQ93880.1 Flagellar hook protein flgE [Methylobacterium oryzae CBMB20]APT34133.1 flagellar hook protein FlgE [Methylobacterium phyllosphaerae]AWV14578.1 flagellar biosynthesis protein FlgE [Methylobacterium sp. XJLW]MBP29659.1 flagellar biosynthesis protein FlgE [Methylobacterium sp.]
MDLFSALQTSVSGLQAQSYAISNISGNIANSQTTGYKRIDTSFVDLMAETTPKREVAGSVLAQSQLTNTIAGNVVSSSVPTNMSISGTGFFTVVQKTGDANNSPTFSGANVYTRRGDFSQDKDGYLVNGAGGYLTGTNLDPTTGQVTSTGPVNIGNLTLPAQETKTITYSANLPATPTVSASAQPPNSIAGPSITGYTTTGAPVTISMRWVQTTTAGTSPSSWDLYYNSSTTDTPSWTQTGPAFTFDSTGKLTSPASTTPVPLTGVQIGDYTFSSLSLDISGGLTQYADASGAVTTKALSQSGNSAGTLMSVAVGEDGKINGTFSNGSVIPVATVGISQFADPDGLKADGKGNYLQTADSGPPLTGLNGSTINGASIEQSNTDIASEFSKMIVTQQAYSANTRVMSTAQTMMSDLLNVIR